MRLIGPLIPARDEKAISGEAGKRNYGYAMAAPLLRSGAIQHSAPNILKMRLLAAISLAGTVVLTAACGSGGRSDAGTTTVSPGVTAATVTTTGSTTSGAGALQAEANATAAGDIPDNQVFLVLRNARGGYSMKYPEGWAQQGSGNSVTFRDKNNVIRTVVSVVGPWTPASVRADLRALTGARVQGQPRAISLSGRPSFKVVYRTVSAPNPVTGKRLTLSVDRYYVWKRGRRAVLDLGCPVGVDNVDAYRLISESFRWS